MANISSAYGTLTITLDEKQPSKKIWALAEALNVVQSNWYYRFYLDETYCDTDACSATFSFNADGRWSFASNLESFGFNMQDTLDNDSKKINFERDIKNIDELKDILINTNYKLTFDYLDSECGMCVLYRSIEELTHKAGDSLDKITHRDLETIDYDYSYAGFLKATDYDFDLAMEEIFGSFDSMSVDDEEVLDLIQKTINDLKSNKDDVEGFLETLKNGEIYIKDVDKLNIDKDFNVTIKDLDMEK